VSQAQIRELNRQFRSDHAALGRAFGSAEPLPDRQIARAFRAYEEDLRKALRMVRAQNAGDPRVARNVERRLELLVKATDRLATAYGAARPANGRDEVRAAQRALRAWAEARGRG
jgi:hypothetical protein